MNGIQSSHGAGKEQRVEPPAQSEPQDPAPAPDPAETGNEEAAVGHEPEAAAPEIMEKLPRTRPRRATARRKPPRPAGPARAAGARQAGGVTAPSGSQAPDPTPFGTAEGAPGIPRLALDGALEAAKLPFRIGANVTFRALDAVAGSLRKR